MWIRSVIFSMCAMGCAPTAQLDAATQAKLDEVIAMAREHAEEKGPPAAPESETTIPAEGGPAQFLALEVSCENADAATNTTVSAWIVRAADGEGGQRLQQAQLACPDRARLGAMGPGEFIAVVDFNVGAPDADAPPWAIDLLVLREGPHIEEQIEKRSWKKGPSTSKGHVATKVTLHRVASKQP